MEHPDTHTSQTLKEGPKVPALRAEPRPYLAAPPQPLEPCPPHPEGYPALGLSLHLEPLSCHRAPPLPKGTTPQLRAPCYLAGLSLPSRCDWHLLLPPQPSGVAVSLLGPQGRQRAVAGHSLFHLLQCVNAQPVSTQECLLPVQS